MKKKLALLLSCFFVMTLLLFACGYNSRDLDEAYDAGRDVGYKKGYEAGYEEGYDNFFSDLLNDTWAMDDFLENLIDVKQANHYFGEAFLNEASYEAEEKTGLDIKDAMYIIYYHESDDETESRRVTEDEYQQAIHTLFYFTRYFMDNFYN